MLVLNSLNVRVLQWSQLLHPRPGPEQAEPAVELELTDCWRCCFESSQACLEMAVVLVLSLRLRALVAPNVQGRGAYRCLDPELGQGASPARACSHRQVLGIP